MSETEITSESSDAPQLPEEAKPARRNRSSRARRVPAPADATEVPPSAGELQQDSQVEDPGAGPVDAIAVTEAAEVIEVTEVAVEGTTADAVAEPVDGSATDGESTDEAPFPEIPDHEIDRAVEALLFASSEPLTVQRVAAVLQVSQRRIKTAIERLREEYAATQRAFDIREIAGGLRLYTRSDFDDLVARLEKVKPPEKLSASALESLAIIAYRQPITRAEIDSIRGVQSGALLKSLTDRKLIRVVGRSEQPGRPLQYGTTKRFLDHFGLASIEDLPRVEDLKAP